MCEVFRGQGARILKEAHKLRDLLTDLRKILRQSEDLIFLREDIPLETGSAEVMEEFWTKLGFNKEKLAEYKGLREFLKIVNEVVGETSSYIDLKIQSLENGCLRLDKANYRCAPLSLPSNWHIPLEQHLENLKLLGQPFVNLTPIDWKAAAKKMQKGKVQFLN